MDEDILKTSSCSTDDSSSMDMMGTEMMMQMDKFPELLYEPPSYNNNTLSTYTEYHNDFSGNSGTEATTLPVFSNVINPNVTHPIPPLSSASLFLNNNNIPLQQQHSNEVVPIPSSGRLNNYNASISEKNNKSRSNSVAAMREMIFRIAVMQPIHIDPESIKPPKRRNVKISKDPQSVAARHRRERISERIRILQRLVPGGTKMDTASMLDEAIHYVKFLKKQVQTLEQAGATNRVPFSVHVNNVVGVSNNVNASVSVNYPANLLMRGCQPCQMVGSPNSKQMLS